nr:peptidoglycan editing factor PgeF [Kribbia dieselivorans]
MSPDSTGHPARVLQSFQVLPGRRGGQVEALFTSRAGGVSTGPYAGLNLGVHVGDEPAAVAANRSRLAAGLGLTDDRVRYLDQVHGTEVVEVTTPLDDAPPSADASVTRQTDVALAVLVADCTPLLLADPEAGVIGAAHAGRLGMLSGVVPATVAAMRDLGARHVQAIVGPSICGRCYAVPADLRDAAAAAHPEAAARTWIGTPAIDVAAGVVAQLADLGVATRWVPGCAREENDLYSHRRDGVTGRYAGVIVRRES